MKIAHVTSRLCRRSAGLRAAVAEISAATEDFANEVRVFGLSSSGWRGGDSETWSGAPTTVFEPAPLSGPLGYAPGLVQSLRIFDPDIIHLHGIWTYPSIAVHQWQREKRRPVVISAHGMLLPISLEQKPLRKKVARILFQDRVLKAADVLHATSTDEKLAYQRLGFAKRIELIPLGLKLITPPNRDFQGIRRRALFIGRLHYHKGIDWIIKAWSKLETDFPEWDLSIVGPLEQSYAREMESIRQTAANFRVSFLGPIYRDEKYRYIAESDLLLMPSRTENFGLAAAEGLMMEVPVIATTRTPWSGLVQADAGWWIDPSPSALEVAMREAMRLPRDQLRTKGENGRRWIEAEFARPIVAAKWQRVYENLL